MKRSADMKTATIKDPLLTLIKLKRAAGRPKDLESLAEMETLLEEGRA